MTDVDHFDVNDADVDNDLEFDADAMERYQRLMAEPDPSDVRRIRTSRFHHRWPDARLQQLFERFAATYWSGRLHGWRVFADRIEQWPDPTARADAGDVIACCDRYDKVIVLDLTRMRPSNRFVQSVLLHEMCHAGATACGHGFAFFQQVERLLARRVRVQEVWRDHLREPELPAILASLPQCAKRFRRAMTGPRD